MSNSIYLLIGFLSSAITYVLFNILNIFCFEPWRINRDKIEFKKNILKNAITEIELNKRKIKNFSGLLNLIQNYEKENKPYLLEYEYIGKYSIRLENFESLIYSDIVFSDGLKIKVLDLYDRFNEYINNLMNIKLYVTPIEAYSFYVNAERLKLLQELSKNLRFVTLLRWFEEINNIENIIEDLKKIIIDK
jgi:Txe/YoeB family toxin of Txe-Axe toxin-antitoxin module